MDESARVVDQQVAQHPWPRHPCPSGAERLAARVDGREHTVAETKLLDAARAPRAVKAGGVGFVHDDEGPVRLGQTDERGKGGQVAIHAERARGHEEGAAAPSGGPTPSADRGSASLVVDQELPLHEPHDPT